MKPKLSYPAIRGIARGCAFLLALTLMTSALPVAEAQQTPVDGIWLGTLAAGGQTLRVQLIVKSDAGGKESCALDSLDQGAMGLECANVVFTATDLSFDVPVV